MDHYPKYGWQAGISHHTAMLIFVAWFFSNVYLIYFAGLSFFACVYLQG